MTRLPSNVVFATALTSHHVLSGATTFAQDNPPATAAAPATAATAIAMTPGEAHAAAFKATNGDISQAGRELNLDGYKKTFGDNLDTISQQRLPLSKEVYSTDNNPNSPLFPSPLYERRFPRTRFGLYFRPRLPHLWRFSRRESAAHR